MNFSHYFCTFWVLYWDCKTFYIVAVLGSHCITYDMITKVFFLQQLIAPLKTLYQGSDCLRYCLMFVPGYPGDQAAQGLLIPGVLVSRELPAYECPSMQHIN